jgi:aryl-alcohol dehydrogenase-like predicted oxidoreductase
MNYTNFGSSGLIVSRLALGMALREQTDEAVAERLIGHALDNGINLIDCANRYSPGDGNLYGGSEEILGSALKGRRDQVVITSKVSSQVGPGPNDRGSSRGHILREVERSLVRLQTDYIDVYLLHAYDNTTPLEETMRVLDDLVRSGKVRYVGACNFGAWQVCKGLWTADRLLATPFMCAQNPYNLLSRQLETEMFPLARDQGLGIMVYGPLAVGLLGGDYTFERRPPANSLWGRRPEKFDRMIQGQAGQIVAMVNEIARELGKTPAQVATAWILDHPEITCSICGSDTIEQLDDSLGSLGWTFDAEHRRRLDAVSNTPAAWN